MRVWIRGVGFAALVLGLSGPPVQAGWLEKVCQIFLSGKPSPSTAKTTPILVDLTEFAQTLLRESPSIDHGTAFKIYATNSSEVIRGLDRLNGIAIAQIESQMRPGKDSVSGFLMPGERLLEVMANDNDLVVNDWNLSHAELAFPMQVVLAAIDKGLLDPQGSFRFRGTRFRMSTLSTAGTQHSPFQDSVYAAGQNGQIANLDNGQSVEFSFLLPDLIAKWGFYEGPQVHHRLAPQNILMTFDFLAPESARSLTRQEGNADARLIKYFEK